MSSAEGACHQKSRRRAAGSRLWALLFVPLVVAAAMLGAGPRQLAQAQTEEGAGVRHLVVTLNKSRTLRFDQPFSSAVVGAPEIVDALPMSDRALYIQGKKVGTTNVSVFDQGMRLIGVVDVEVTPDVGNLQEKIRGSSGSRGIRVSSSNGQIVLSGVAGNAVAAERAAAVARSMVPEGGSIVNAMTVAPAQQVMLKVRFLEVARSASRELGVNWFGANNGGNRGFNTGTGGLTPSGQPRGRPAVTGVDASGNPVPAPGSPAGSGAIGIPLFTAAGTLLSGAAPFGVAVANLATKGGSLDVVLSALESKGLIRQLAEPELMALSGDTASFLAGGEYPVPTCQSAQTTGTGCAITIQYQPFGVQLTFNPTVLENGIINMRLAPSVSELNFATAIVLNGFSIPSLDKREARTTVELRDGQSFSIAGLLRLENRRAMQQLPWIGSVPVLGTLFGSKSFQDTETDLVVIVTPHLVAPAVPGQRLATPDDNHIPSNDVDFFLMGQIEQRKEFRNYITSGDGIQGPYGHIIGQGPAAPPLPPAGAVLRTKN